LPATFFTVCFLHTFPTFSSSLVVFFGLLVGFWFLPSPYTGILLTLPILPVRAATVFLNRYTLLPFSLAAVDPPGSPALLLFWPGCSAAALPLVHFLCATVLALPLPSLNATAPNSPRLISAPLTLRATPLQRRPLAALRCHRVSRDMFSAYPLPSFLPTALSAALFRAVAATLSFSSRPPVPPTARQNALFFLFREHHAHAAALALKRLWDGRASPGDVLS